MHIWWAWKPQESIPCSRRVVYGVYGAQSRLVYHCADSPVSQLRLTYNYWRKGGYSVGSEDYRWEILRKYISPPLFFVFNVLFISLAQSVLLFSITTPAYILLLMARLTSPAFPKDDLFNTPDLIFSRVMMACVLLAFFADQSQWNFQQAKMQYQKTAKVPSGYQQDQLDRGFNTTGLWLLSRHPNFAAEQLFWMTLYQWGCWQTERYFNWTAIGIVGYLILFQASTWFTEKVSASKYPEYSEYQARVGRFIPRLTTEPMKGWSTDQGRRDIDGGKDKEEDPDKAKARERYDLR